MQDKPLTTVPDAMRPAFDYSGLTDQTVEDLHFAEDEYRHGKQMAERGLVHMGNAIAAAHDALCGVVQLLDNSKHGNRGMILFGHGAALSASQSQPPTTCCKSLP